MVIKRVSIEMIIEVPEGTPETEYAQTYGKFIERITHGDFNQENIVIQDI